MAENAELKREVERLKVDGMGAAERSRLMARIADLEQERQWDTVSI